MTRFAIIAAMDQKQGIGVHGKLPWRLPAELERFKAITTSTELTDSQNAVIMGRKTWESLPASVRPLPGRINVVLSSQDIELPEDVYLCRSLDDVFNLDLSSPIESVFFIGGAKVFADALVDHRVTSLYLTHVEKMYHCDVFFPKFGKEWVLVDRSEPINENGVSYFFTHYHRKK